MNFDYSQTESRDFYKLLTGLIVPRPIALVTTLNEEGVVNAAPFSFFNCVGSNPPLVVFAPASTRHTVTTTFAGAASSWSTLWMKPSRRP
jgi:flavin reductase (DIM6/NTAB) family NADH-FMN oxidoreductase RutF